MTNATAPELHQETGLYDMTNLSRMKSLTVHAPEAMNAFVVFGKAALAAGPSAGEVHRRYRRKNLDRTRSSVKSSAVTEGVATRRREATKAAGLIRQSVDDISCGTERMKLPAASCGVSQN